MVINKRNNKIETKRYLFLIDSIVGLGRETLRVHGPMKNLKAPSLYFYLEEDERTQINASFLPFFALLSIPPSFN